MANLPGSSTQIAVDGRTTRTRDYVAGPVRFGPPGATGPAGPTGATGPAGSGAVSDAANLVTDYGAVADDSTSDSSALQAALDDASAPHIYVPPGVYKINSNVSGGQADQVIEFAPGAVLQPAAGVGITFSGARMQLRGRLTATVNSSSASTYVVLGVSGTGSIVDDVSINVNDDVANATLFKVTGQDVRVREYRLTGAGKAFNYGIHAITSGGAELKGVLFDRVLADVGDDGATVTFGALIYNRSTRSTYRHIHIDAGGRASFPNGVVIDDAHFMTLEDPFIAAPKAKYGVYAKDGAEFLYIRGGWIQQQSGDMTQVIADSEAIYLGHNCDHFSAKDVSCTGFDYGLGFHGSNNIPNLDGLDVSNNKTAGILIDSEIAGEAWPVSGLAITCGYAENAALNSQPIYIWAKSGQVIGGVLLGCGSLGYTTYLIKIETAIAAFIGFKIDGNRIIATDNTGAGILPNTNTDIVWGDANDTERSNTISSGTYAAKVRQSRDPLLNGVTVGSSGTRVSKYYSDVYTLNFNANPEVAQIQDVVATVPGVAVGDMVAVSVPDSHVFAAASQGDVYFCWVSSAGHVTVRRLAGAHFTPGSGSFRISYWQH